MLRARRTEALPAIMMLSTGTGDTSERECRSAGFRSVAVAAGMRHHAPRPCAAGPRRRAHRAGVLLLLTVSGCVKVGPDFVPPEAPVAENWLASGDPRIKTAAPQDAAWWQTLNDPKLSELVRIAQQQNPTVQTAGVRVLQARAQLGATIGDLYPQKQQVYGEVTHERLSDSESSRGLSRDVAQRSGVRRNLPSLDEQQLLGRAVRRSARAGSWISGASSDARSNPRMPASWPRSPATTMPW